MSKKGKDFLIERMEEEGCRKCDYDFFGALVWFDPKSNDSTPPIGNIIGTDASEEKVREHVSELVLLCYNCKKKSELGMIDASELEKGL